MENKDEHRYDDIIELPHHVSAIHPQMPVSDRAAQFAAFAALTGYEAAIRETARLTDERMELEEDTRALLDEKLTMLLELLPGQPGITVTYFQPDERKNGGHYVSVTGRIKKIDRYEHTLVMTDGRRIPLSEILELEGGMSDG